MQHLHSAKLSTRSLVGGAPRELIFNRLLTRLQFRVRVGGRRLRPSARRKRPASGLERRDGGADELRSAGIAGLLEEYPLANRFPIPAGLGPFPRAARTIAAPGHGRIKTERANWRSRANRVPSLPGTTAPTARRTLADYGLLIGRGGILSLGDARPHIDIIRFGTGVRRIESIPEVSWPLPPAPACSHTCQESPLALARRFCGR